MGSWSSIISAVTVNFPFLKPMKVDLLELNDYKPVMEDLENKFTKCLVAMDHDHLKGNKKILPRWQWWRSGESTCLPPITPGFDSLTRRHMLVEFVGSLLCSERFFPGYSGSPLFSKTYI